MKELEQGYYYIRWSYDIDDEPSYMIDFFNTEDYTGGAFENKQRKFIDEIVSKVPSYEEYKHLQEVFVKDLDTKLEIKECYSKLEKQSIEIVELTEKLNDACAFIEDIKNFTCSEEAYLQCAEFLERFRK